MAERWVLSTFTIVLLLLALLRPATAWQIHDFFSGSAAENSDSLRIENDALRGELAALADVRARMPKDVAGATPAFVMVRYPFNFKNQILVNAGRKDGIEVGSKVIVPGSEYASSTGMLLGKVQEVYEDSSLVQTIFDAGFQLGARVGGAGEQTLLKGGSDPLLTLIPKNTQIHGGEIAYAASQGYPYGLAIGEVRDVTPSNGGLLQQATLRFPYDVNQVHVVLILP